MSTEQPVPLGLVWMAESHELLATIPLADKERFSEQSIRALLHEAVTLRFAEAAMDVLDVFHDSVSRRPLRIYEDDEHGHQYGVVLR